MNYAEKSLKKHYEWRGKIEISRRVDVKTGEDLSLAYTPRVAAPCLEIQKDENKSYELTRRWNTVAVITEDMKLAAARGIASLVDDEELSPDYIIPRAFDPRVGMTVAKAVYDSAVKTGVARIKSTV